MTGPRPDGEVTLTATGCTSTMPGHLEPRRYYQSCRVDKFTRLIVLPDVIVTD